MDTMHGTAATVAQATHVPRRAIEEVNLDKDSEWNGCHLDEHRLTASVALSRQAEGRRLAADCPCTVPQLLCQSTKPVRSAKLKRRLANVDRSSSA